jgi:anti-anti-sigma factor
LRTGAITELQRLTVSLRGGFEPQDQCLLFHFTGQLDAYSERQFRDFIAQHQGSSKQAKLPLVLDLTHIDFLDSSGLGALVQVAKQCTDSKQRFLVVGNSRVVQTIKLVRLESFLNLQPDLGTALSSLATA